MSDDGGPRDRHPEAFPGDFQLGMVGSDQLGIPGTNAQNRTDLPRASMYAGVPGLSTGFQAIGTAANWTPMERNEKTFSFSTNLTTFAGRHELRGGYNVLRVKLGLVSSMGKSVQPAVLLGSRRTAFRNPSWRQTP